MVPQSWNGLGIASFSVRIFYTHVWYFNSKVRMPIFGMILESIRIWKKTSPETHGFFCCLCTLTYIHRIFKLRYGAPVVEWARNRKFFCTHFLHSLLIEYFISLNILLMPGE